VTFPGRQLGNGPDSPILARKRASFLARPFQARVRRAAATGTRRASYSTEDAADLTASDVLAAEIMEELEAALGEFAAIVDDLDKTTA
jgi:hypothetical protein